LPALKEALHKTLVPEAAGKYYRTLEWGIKSYPFSVGKFVMTEGAYNALQEYKRAEGSGGELTVRGQTKKPDKRGRLMTSDELLEIASDNGLTISTEQMENAIWHAVAETSYQ
jgi:hypothetical protein